MYNILSFYLLMTTIDMSAYIKKQQTNITNVFLNIHVCFLLLAFHSNCKGILESSATPNPLCV